MEDNAKALAAENEIKRYGQFVEDFSEKLKLGLKSNHALPFDAHLLPNISHDNPLRMSSAPFEGISLPTLVLGSTDNSMLGKVILALAAVTSEMEFLISPDELGKKFLDPLLLYGTDIQEGDHGDALLAFSRLLPTLNDLSCYVDHCTSVVRNVMHQLSALHGDNPQAMQGGDAGVIGVTDVHFQVVFEKLSQLLTGLITLDELVEMHPFLRDHWASYKRMIKAAQVDPQKYGLTMPNSKERLKRMEKLIDPIEHKIIEANMLKTCIHQNFDIHGFQVRKNSHLADEFMFCLRNLLLQVETEFVGAGNSNFSTLDPENRLKLVGLTALIAFYQCLFQMQDKKFMYKYWEVCKKAPGLTLYGNIMWFPDQLLPAYLDSNSQLIDRKVIQAISAGRQSFLQNRAQMDIKPLQHQLNSWVVRMESGFKLEVSKLSVEHLQSVADLLMQGVQIATNIATNVAMILNLHAKLSVPLNKASAVNLCKMIELLKVIEVTFARHSLSILSIVNHICQHISFISINIIEKAKRGAVSDKRYNRSHLDALSAMLLAQKMIAGPATPSRRLVARLALAFATQTKMFREDEVASLVNNLRRLSTLSSIQARISDLCDASFIFFHRVLIPIHFGFIFDADKKEASRLPYIFMALNDCAGLLSSAKHCQDSKQLMRHFDAEVRRHLKEQILDPLCGAIETELRLEAHTHLKLDDNNPFRQGIKPLTNFLQLPTFQFLDKQIDIKAFVEAYLEKTFYNMTTLALHNWRTYGEMRALARHKYRADTADDHLPPQTLEQGLDVLEIMRNIHVFVAGYLYNLNNQIFVEKASQNKHLNTINIGHVSNSIRTHGTGVMNTAVNFSYQFLRKKFSVFSQVLYDEQIKSRLLKDIRFFRESRDKLDQKYPYERAGKFNRGIRKLGSTDGLHTILDHFRMLVTEIGNAMGYVRMIRSGGLHFVSNSIRFIPDLEDLQNFEKLATDEGLAEDTLTMEAARNLDEVVQNLSKSFTEGSQYFQLLVNVFTKQFNSDKQSHLKNFYIMIPPLTINFVDYLIASKEKMAKKNKNGAAFTDDGLAMGIAYVLRLLDQNEDFDSLHWFQSVNDMYRYEMMTVDKELKSQAQDPKLQQTLELKMKRLQMEQKEFELLNFSLSSARIFFRKVNIDEDSDDVSATTKDK